MSAHHTGRRAWVALLPAAMLITGAMAAETPVRFTLDFKFEGPSAPFLLALDKGYYKAEGLNVTVDTGPGSVAGIARVAAGTYPLSCAGTALPIQITTKRASISKLRPARRCTKLVAGLLDMIYS